MIYRIETTWDNANIQALGISKEIESINPGNDDVVGFDFSHYREANPFSNLVLINSILNYKTAHPDIHIRIRQKDNDTYLPHIGFYKALKVPIGKELSEAIANPNYVPVTTIPFSAYFYDEIVKRSDELAKTIQFDHSFQEFLGYLFQETIRNAFEHADTDNALVAAQNWPSKNTLEVAIADSGCGIASTLRSHFAKDDLGLLEYALRPGITAGSNFGYKDVHDPWRNTGYGLYMIRQAALACNGSFIICSDGNALRYYRDKNGYPAKSVYETRYKGTAIGIRFRTDISLDFEALISRIRMEGELLAAQTDGAIRSASKSSSGRFQLKL